MKYSHVIFDIDGTLIDTEKAVLRSLQKTILEVKGIKKDLDELKFALGIPGKDALIKLGIEDLEKVECIWTEFFNEYSDEICVFDGIGKILQELKSNFITLGIITSKTRKEYEDDFMNFGLDDCFNAVICADDTIKHKPNAEPMEEYLKYTNAKREDTIYIGDSIYDVMCATNAGVDSALALWGRDDSDNIKSTYYLNCPNDILNILFNKSC
ncbi:HAD family hydrolase [Clostridium cagae]|uniref:HAD family hydrolase n=1 Tax=Clostridium cagae TaxID=2080751 RepID=UPI003F758BF9